ncbi:MAG: hypothetical protein ACQEQV_10035 [Fibrobacterota bacterium]
MILKLGYICVCVAAVCVQSLHSRVIFSGRMACGDTLVLSPVQSMIFTGNSHKRTTPEGPPSPLIINLEYLDGDSVENVSEYLHDIPGQWNRGMYHYVLRGYQYGEWMDLEVTKRKPKYLFPFDSGGTWW